MEAAIARSPACSSGYCRLPQYLGHPLGVPSVPEPPGAVRRREERAVGPCAKGALGLCRGAEEMGDDDVLHHAHALVAQPLPHRGDQHRTLRRRAGHRPRGCNAAVSNLGCHQEFSKRGDRCKGANTRKHKTHAVRSKQRVFLVATATQSVCLSVG